MGICWKRRQAQRKEKQGVTEGFRVFLLPRLMECPLLHTKYFKNWQVLSGISTQENTGLQMNHQKLLCFTWGQSTMIKMSLSKTKRPCSFLSPFPHPLLEGHSHTATLLFAYHCTRTNHFPLGWSPKLSGFEQQQQRRVYDKWGRNQIGGPITLWCAHMCMCRWVCPCVHTHVEDRGQLPWLFLKQSLSPSPSPSSSLLLPLSPKLKK